jgi:hypothetical protein
MNGTLRQNLNPNVGRTAFSWALTFALLFEAIAFVAGAIICAPGPLDLLNPLDLLVNHHRTTNRRSRKSHGNQPRISAAR